MKNQLVLAVALSWVAFFSPSNNAYAWQSGSRSTPAPQSVLTPAPQQGFAQPATGTPPQFEYAQPSSGFAQPQMDVPYQDAIVQGEIVSEVPFQSDNRCGVCEQAQPMPQATSDNIWAINQPSSNVAVDHSIWSCFLSQYVVTDNWGLNRVKYAEVTANDRQSLQTYLQQLQSTDVRVLNRSEQLAFWLNFYNAQTLETILANYRVRSIRQIKSSPLDVMGPFDDPAVSVLGQTLSLSDIENNIVRANWKDPRVHYALNCASYGCPNLSRTAWQASDLDARLNQAATNFINSGRAVRTGAFGGTVAISKIFKWYKEDFGGTDEAVLAHISQYASPQLRAKLSRRSSITYHFYDWSLNDARVIRSPFIESIIR